MYGLPELVFFLKKKKKKKEKDVYNEDQKYSFSYGYCLAKN